MMRSAGVAVMAFLLWAPSARAQRAGSDTGHLTTSDQIKATGCVAKDESGVFTLGDAEIEVEPYYGPGAASAKGAAKRLATKTKFILENGTNLETHIGQKIRVTGSVAPASASSADSVEVPAPAPAAGRGGRGGSQRMYIPRLNVRSIEMVSARCQ